MDTQPIRGLHYVSITGPKGQAGIFRREVSKLKGWALYDRDNVLHVARRDTQTNAGETARAAVEQAKRLLQNVRRALILGGQEPLSGLACGASFSISEDGKTRYILAGDMLNVQVRGEVSIELKVIRAGEAAVIPPRDLTLERLQALEVLNDDAALQTILAMFEFEGDRWGTLYNILERVRAALGTDVPREWISRAKLELLERTANHDKAGGLTARHHAAKTEPPAEPMPLDVARDHVRRILDKLIQRRAGGTV